MMRNDMLLAHATRRSSVYAVPVLLASSALGCRHPVVLTPTSSSVIVVSSAGFNQPENLVYDSVADVFLVSNMGGGNTARDDNGFISRVAPDGRVLALRWIAGGQNGVELDAPKGLAIRGDTLVVADLGGVRYFDRRTGAPLKSLTLPGLVMNDVAFAPDGTLWITDTGPSRTPTPVDTSKDLDAVWLVTPGGRVTAAARGLSLERPDGIALDGGSALVATFGGDRIERVVPSQQQSTMITLPGDSVDGLRRMPSGDLLVTSWQARTVWRLDEGAKPMPLLENVTSPAGVAVDTRRHHLAVTSMKNNALYLLPLG